MNNYEKPPLEVFIDSGFDMEHRYIPSDPFSTCHSGIRVQEGDWDLIFNNEIDAKQ